MKLPRDLSADRLISVLKSLGYQVLRQKGSHIRLRHEGPPTHLITIPRHEHLKTGTLQGILAEIAMARSLSVASIAELL